ncbi:hypothetical protein MOUN0_M07954 [Monosporozyma unispora]
MVPRAAEFARSIEHCLPPPIALTSSGDVDFSCISSTVNHQLDDDGDSIMVIMQNRASIANWGRGIFRRGRSNNQYNHSSGNRSSGSSSAGSFSDRILFKVDSTHIKKQYNKIAGNRPSLE